MQGVMTHKDRSFFLFFYHPYIFHLIEKNTDRQYESVEGAKQQKAVLPFFPERVKNKSDDDQ